MSRTVALGHRASGNGSSLLVGGVGAILGLYWLCLLAVGTVRPASVPLAVLAFLLATFVPGGLMTVLLGLTPRTFARFSVSAVSLGCALVGVLVVATSTMLPVVGVERPLSPLVFGLVLSATVAVLAGAVYHYGGEVPPVGRLQPFPIVVGLAVLPSIAALAAGAMNRTGNPVGMYVLVGCVVAVVALTATRHLPRDLYPPTVFAVTAATLLHRNLLTSYVIGADVQGLAAVAERAVAAGLWSPALSGISVPVVTGVPAAVAGISGLEVNTTFKLFTVFVYTFVPLGVYFVGRDVFDHEVGLYGALLLVFYHYTFSVTPGKQLVSQLFVVGLLLTLWSTGSGVSGDARKLIAVALLSVGLVLSHYGTAYTIGAALLVAAVVAPLVGVVSDTYTRRFGVGVPLGILIGATAWYGATDPDTLIRLASIPVVAVDQIAALVVGRATAQGSGASYVAGQRGPIEFLNVLLYVAVTALLVGGVATRLFGMVDRVRSRTVPDDLEYTVLALPLVALLAASYVLSLNLWADRVYQLVLVVLAPFVPVGYRAFDRVLGRSFDRWRSPAWTVLAVLLAGLLIVNSGVAFALVGSASTSTFDPGANDLVFDGREQAGVEWIGTHGGIGDLRTGDTASTGGVDDPDQVQIYTDSVSSHLFRSALPPGYTTADVVLLRSQWRPVFDPDRIDDGFVYLRAPAVAAAADGRPLPTTSISEGNATAITTESNVVYTNGAVRVVQTGNATG